MIKKIGENMDKVSFIVETLANINQSILLIYFLCGTLNVNKKINSKIAVISGVSIIFAYLEIQYMVVPFEGLLAYCGQCLSYMRAFLWMAIYFRKCMLQCLL